MVNCKKLHLQPLQPKDILLVLILATSEMIYDTASLMAFGMLLVKKGSDYFDLNHSLKAKRRVPK